MCNTKTFIKKDEVIMSLFFSDMFFPSFENFRNSDDGNIAIIINKNTKKINLYALRDIKEYEELTINPHKLQLINKT